MIVLFILHILHIIHIIYILHIHFVQDAFDPAGIEFNTCPTMAKQIVDVMLPEQDGEVHKLSLHEGKVNWLEMCIYISYFEYLTFCVRHLNQHMEPRQDSTLHYTHSG